MELRGGVLRFSDEGEAWEFLGKIADGAQPPDGVSNIFIEHFPLEILYFPDEKRGHTITARTAKAVTEFHAAFSKGYAAALYGTPNRRILTSEDNEVLNIKFYVKDGSTGYDVVKDLFWDNFVAKAAEKMSGGQITAVLLTLIVGYFGHSLIRHYIDKRTETKRDQSSTDADVRRWEIMERLVERIPAARAIADSSVEAGVSLLKAATQMPRSRVLGVDVTMAEAVEVLTPERVSGAGRRVDGVYDIVEVGTDNPDGLTGRFRRVSDGLAVDAVINYAEITKEEVLTLATALPEKDRLSLKVNAWFVGDKITRASIVRIDPA